MNKLSVLKIPDLGGIDKAVSDVGTKTVVIVEVLTLMLIVFLVVVASYASIRDLREVLSPHVTYSEIADLILNDIFMLIILAELIRFIVALRASPGSRIIGLAEVGLIVSIREVVIASLTKEYMGLLLASTASLMLALIIWVVKAKIMRQ